ncbi:MAG: TonB-dependent receptor [Bacteroidales bacterium]|nr:TonB-dependent receptor [Bacteroidales bacterium]
MKTTHTNIPYLAAALLLALMPAVGRTQQPHEKHDSLYRSTLHEVHISGPTGETTTAHTPMAVSTVDGLTLRQTAATNLIDALSHQPGVAQIATGTGISKPVIRGLSHNRIVVVSDNVRQEGQQWGDEHGVELDEADVSAVEIIKGPASLMYGSDAMGGVIVLRPASPLPDGELRLNAGGEYQSVNGLWGGHATLSGAQRGFFYRAHYGEQAAHAYRNHADGYVPGSQLARRTLSAELGRRFDRGQSRLSFSHYHLVPGIVEGERDSTDGSLVLTTDPKRYAAELPFQVVNHNKLTWDNQLHLGTGTLLATLSLQQNDRREYEDEEDEYELGMRLHTAQLTTSWQQQLHDFRYNTGLALMAQKMGNHGEETLLPDYRQADGGLFATAEYTARRWDIVGGLRADMRHLVVEDDVLHYGNVSGSIGTVCHLSPHWQSRLNVARAFRAPSVYELTCDGVHEGTGRYEIGNSALASEHSLQADWGTEYHSQRLSVQIALFASYIDNYIYLQRLPTDIEPSLPTFGYTQGDARLIGGEAAAEWHPSDHWTVGATASLLDAQQRHQPDEARYLPFIPPAQTSARVAYRLPSIGRLLGTTRIELNCEHHFAQRHCHTANATETPTPAYTLIGIACHTSLLIRGSKAAELTVAINNLTDCAYQDHLSRLKYAGINPLTHATGVCNPGRNIVVRLHVPLSLSRAAQP